ncbi:MAG: flippase [Clostridia bacterium]|nr:flippase [Clostridia bacterium]
MIKNKVFKNATWIIACKVIQAILGVIISSLTARYLGDSNFGVINYAISMVTFFIPVMQLGFSNVMVQELVERPNEEGKILGTSLYFNVISAICCIFGIIGFSSVINAGQTEKIIVCGLYSLVLLSQALEMVQYWFQAKYISRYVSIISLIAYGLTTVYKIYLLATGKNVYWFAISNALDYMIIAVASLVLYKRLGGQRLSVSFAVAKRMFSKSKHYIISSMMVTIFAQTDKIMINVMIGDKETGWYSAAVACAGMTSFVFSAIIDSARPSIFTKLKQSQESFDESVILLYSIVIYLALAQSVLMTIFAGPIIGILYGEQFAPAVTTLRIVVWYTTFSYLGSARGVWILANNQQKILWKINMSGALINVVLNAILIPVMGINGAAIASFITQFFANFFIGFMMKPLRKNNMLILRALNPIQLIKATKRLFKKEKDEKTN